MATEKKRQVRVTFMADVEPRSENLPLKDIGDSITEALGYRQPIGSITGLRVEEVKR